MFRSTRYIFGKDNKISGSLTLPNCGFTLVGQQRMALLELGLYDTANAQR